MIRLRTLAALAAVIVAAPAVASAQATDTAMKQTSTGAVTSMSPRDQLLQGVNLSSTQQAQADSIFNKYQGQMAGLDPNKPEDKKTWKDLVGKEVNDLRKILTPEQLSKLQSNANAMMSSMK